MKIVHSSVAVIIVSAHALACSGTDPAVESVGSTTQADTVIKSHSEWSGGSAAGSVNGPSSSLSFTASENTAGTSRTANLQLWGNGSDPSSQVCTTDTYCKAWDFTTMPPTCTASVTYTYCYYTRTYFEYGYGAIPSGDFLVGKHGAHLTTNLANDPALTVTLCTSDTAAGTYTCAPATGTIDVTWSDNGNFSSENDQTMTSKYVTPYSSFTTKSSGKWTSSSANVSGTVLGASANGQGSISQSKGKSVSKDIIEEGGGSFDGGFGPG